MKKHLIALFTLIVGLSPIANAYRDLETGTFLTRDPIGYADGPNVYCYVHCNPITHFDPLGLLDHEDYQEQIDATNQQIADEYEAFNNSLESLDRNKLVDFLLMGTKREREHLSKLSKLYDKRLELSQSQAALKDNPYGDDDIDPKTVGWRFYEERREVVEGIPKIGYRNNKGEYCYRNARKDEISDNFVSDGKGGLRGKSIDEIFGRARTVVGEKIDAINHYMQPPMLVVGYGSAFALAGPAVIGMSKDAVAIYGWASPYVKMGATATANYWMQNAPQMNEAASHFMSNVFGGPQTGIGSGQGAAASVLGTVLGPDPQ